MYVAVKGGERAISNAHKLFAEKRRGDTNVVELSLDQIVEQLRFAVDRVMCEGSLYDPRIAALAIKQSGGDLIEAIFLVRAFRTTLPRFGYATPVETADMVIKRRVSAIFKDIPGGQTLGPTFDYSHRLLDFSLADEEINSQDLPPSAPSSPDPRRSGKSADNGSFEPTPRVTTLLGQQGLLEPDLPVSPEVASSSNTDELTDTNSEKIGDLTREPLEFPAQRDLRLQSLARGDEGFLLALGYSTQRGFARTHPFVGELRIGAVEVSLYSEELDMDLPLGSIEVTECQMVNQFQGTAEAPPQFTRGYGLVFGQSERKAMAMALVDRALRAHELGEELTAPAQDEEFVLSHADNIQATGFVEHLKLPHYVDFQAELDLVRQLRREHEESAREPRHESDDNTPPEQSAPPNAPIEALAHAEDAT